MSDHEHTLTLTDAGETFITEHVDDPGFTLHSACLVYKIAHRAFEASPGVRPITDHQPKPGRYRITLGDDSNLHLGSRIPDPTEQDTPA